MFAAVDQILEWLTTQSPFLVALVILLYVALEGLLLIGVVIPGDLSLIIAGTTVDSVPEGPLVVAGGLGGVAISAFSGHWIGSHFGPASGGQGGPLGRRPEVEAGRRRCSTAAAG